VVSVYTDARAYKVELSERQCVARMCGVAELEDAIRRYIRDHNGEAKPFVWTKTPKDIFDKLARLPEPSE
jgi:hypothetical protein